MCCLCVWCMFLYGCSERRTALFRRCIPNRSGRQQPIKNIHLPGITSDHGMAACTAGRFGSPPCRDQKTRVRFPLWKVDCHHPIPNEIPCSPLPPTASYSYMPCIVVAFGICRERLRYLYMMPMWHHRTKEMDGKRCNQRDILPC